MTDNNHSPVALDAGGYDHDKLMNGLAAVPAAQDRAEAISEALRAGRAGKAIPDDTSATPGYSTKKVTRKLNDDISVSETIQVATPEVDVAVESVTADASEADDSAATARGRRGRGAADTAGEASSTDSTSAAVQDNSAADSAA